MTEPIRVVCAMPYPLNTVPAQRFRWEQWRPGLLEHGVDLELLTFSTDRLHQARAAGRAREAALEAARRYPEWLLEILRSRRAPLFVIHRNAALSGPPLVELALHRLNKPFVYDFDDAVYLAPPAGDTWAKRFMRADWRVAALSRRAALVSAGSPVLADFALQFTDRVEIWPTTISLASYTERPEPPEDRVPVIGWSGSHTTVRYIRSLMPLLRELRARVPFRLKVVGAEVELGGLEGECIPWSPEIELPALHDMDVGLMPLEDIEFARGKCALKALQYSGVGVPAVVSDVGVNREAVIDGETGYVVRTDEQWLEALTRLLEDRAMRLQMGRAGRAHVAKHFSAEVWAPRIAKRLRRLAEH